MKKYFVSVTFIIVILVMTGCRNKNAENQFHKYGIQPPIENLYWSMTISEIEDTLSIKDNEDGVTYKHIDYGTMITIHNRFKKFGYDVSVLLEITDPPTVELAPYKTEALIAMKLIFTNIDKEDLKGKLIKKFGENGRDWISIVDNECTTWESKDKISDLNSTELEKLKSYWDVRAKNSAEFSLASENSVDDTINSVILAIHSSEADATATLTYKGGNAIMINKLCLSDEE